jgi:hypothetical protein
MTVTTDGRTIATTSGTVIGLGFAPATPLSADRASPAQHTASKREQRAAPKPTVRTGEGDRLFIWTGIVPQIGTSLKGRTGK